jgi:GNAT superfamily N-acetyltransferase
VLSLLPVFSGDPFAAYPQLQSIWPEPLLSRARYDTVESLVDIEEEDFGAIFLVLAGAEVIGITGYYFYDDTGIELGLRWHGLLPQWRGAGRSARVIDLLLRYAVPRVPQATTLIELIPDTEYGVALRRHFGKLGFVSAGPVEHYDWSSHGWQPYHLAIDPTAT